MSVILDTLRPGDILTHSYMGAPNVSGLLTNIVQDGRLIPAALAAKKRGVVFDVGHGGASFDLIESRAWSDVASAQQVSRFSFERP
jgi:dihydroorotase